MTGTAPSPRLTSLPVRTRRTSLPRRPVLSGFRSGHPKNALRSPSPTPTGALPDGSRCPSASPRPSPAAALIGRGEGDRPGMDGAKLRAAAGGDGMWGGGEIGVPTPCGPCPIARPPLRPRGGPQAVPPPSAPPHIPATPTPLSAAPIVCPLPPSPQLRITAPQPSAPLLHIPSPHPNPPRPRGPIPHPVPAVPFRAPDPTAVPTIPPVLSL